MAKLIFLCIRDIINFKFLKKKKKIFCFFLSYIIIPYYLNMFKSKYVRSFF